MLGKISPTPPKKYLSEAAWRVALPALVEATYSADATDLRMAGAFASHLCAFLHHHPDWDGTAPPDWDVLLTEETIDRYIALRVAGGVSDSLRSAHQVTLRRVLGAASPEDRPSRPPRAGPGHSPRPPPRQAIRPL